MIGSRLIGATPVISRSCSGLARLRWSRSARRPDREKRRKRCRREWFEAECDSMVTRRYEDGAKQEASPPDRCRFAVDLGYPTGIVQLVQHKQAVHDRGRAKLHAART